jgi:hypothetical protein
MNGKFDKIPVSQAIRKCLQCDGTGTVHAGTTDRRRSVGHIKLTYAAKQLFNISRFSTHSERWGDIGHAEFRELADAMEATTADEWRTLIDDLSSVYDSLQRALSECYPNGIIPMQRRLHLVSIDDRRTWKIAGAREHLTYGKHLAVAALKAQQEGRDFIEFDADVLTGWCSREPGAYGEILVQLDVPIQDVFLANRYLDSSGLESDEWLILNRAPTGILRISAYAVSISTEQETFDELRSMASNLSWDSLRAYQLGGARDRAILPLRPQYHWDFVLNMAPDDPIKERVRWWHRFRRTERA